MVRCLLQKSFNTIPWKSCNNLKDIILWPKQNSCFLTFFCVFKHETTSLKSIFIHFYYPSSRWLVSFAAVFWDVTQCSPQRNSCSHPKNILFIVFVVWLQSVEQTNHITAKCNDISFCAKNQDVTDNLASAWKRSKNTSEVQPKVWKRYVNDSLCIIKMLSTPFILHLTPSTHPSHSLLRRNLTNRSFS